MMRFLLLDGPFSGLACQPLSIGTHESPAVVEELSNNFYWACIQIFDSSSLHVFKPYFIDFPISSFAPPPILCDLSFHS
jgi:hypothetical protein